MLACWLCMSCDLILATVLPPPPLQVHASSRCGCVCWCVPVQEQQAEWVP